MRKTNASLTAILLAAGLGLAAPGPASAATSCAQVWGATAESRPAMSAAHVTNVRTGKNACFDRLVVDLNGAAAGYTVRYVPVVVQDGSGFHIPVYGAAAIQATVNAPSYDQNNNLTYNPAAKAELSDVSGYQTFRQVVFAGSFEGYTSIGIGVRARLPFRVFTLDGPGNGSRLVIDVAHSW